MSKTIVVSGASSGLGAITGRALADAGHTVYAGMRDPSRRNQKAVAELQDHATTNAVNLHAVEMDAGDQESIDAAITHVVGEAGVGPHFPRPRMGSPLPGASMIRSTRIGFLAVAAAAPPAALAVAGEKEATWPSM